MWWHVVDIAYSSGLKNIFLSYHNTSALLDCTTVQGCEFGAIAHKIAPSLNCSATTKNVTPPGLVISSNKIAVIKLTQQAI